MRILRYLIGFIVILILVVLAIPFILPADLIAGQVASVTKDQTGRELKLGGDISFSVYPDLAVSMSDVSLSNPPGMPPGVMMTTQRMRLSLQAMPLFSGNIKVKTFELVEPTLNLLTDESGRSNWSFSSPDDTAAASIDPAPSEGVSVSELSLDDIRIVDGVVRYLDETAGTTFEGSKLNVALSLPQLDGKLNVKGSLLWRGDKVDIATVLGPVDKLNQEKATNLELQVTSKHLNAQFTGIISLLKGFALDGTITAQTPSLRLLADWTGKPLAAGRGLKDFSATAAVKLGTGKITLNDAKFGLDGMRAQGNMTIDTAGARPKITASLGVDKIDINQYLSEPSATSSASANPDAGWSDQPIDFSGLRAVDANLRMAASRIQYRDVTMGNSQVSVAIKNGRLKAVLEKLSLYEGSATGSISLDGAAASPTLATSFATQGVSALPLLRDFAKFDWIEGTAQLKLNLKGAGRSQRQLVESLAGNAQVLFENGAIRGINVAAMMRGLGTNILSGWSRAESQKTDFAALSASYAITNGVATNTDLQMIGPLVRLTGQGKVDMPKKRLNYKVDPKLVASLQGQGGEADLAGFNVPIKIKGPWHKPDIYPDIAGILENPAEALKQLKGIGKIDPSKLGVGDGTIEKATDALQETLKQDGGGVINDLLKGLGNN